MHQRLTLAVSRLLVPLLTYRCRPQGYHPLRSHKSSRSRGNRKMLGLLHSQSCGETDRGSFGCGYTPLCGEERKYIQFKLLPGDALQVSPSKATANLVPRSSRSINK